MADGDRSREVKVLLRLLHITMKVGTCVQLGHANLIQSLSSSGPEISMRKGGNISLFSENMHQSLII